jgi:hypothetical protein
MDLKLNNLLNYNPWLTHMPLQMQGMDRKYDGHG